MPLKVRFITSLVILLLSFEIFGAALTACATSDDGSFYFHAKKSSASVINSIFIEKAEEETEKNEEEKDGTARPVLVDFSRVVTSLSFRHTPQTEFTPFRFQYDVRPPLHTINCVFLI